MARVAAAPLLLLHGAGAGAWQWRLWQDVLAADGFDARAETLAPAAAGLAATRLDDYVAQVEQMADRCRAAPVVVGASLGGLLALRLAARRPCRALVLINPLPPAPEAAGLPAPDPRDVGPVIAWHSRGRFGSTARLLADADPATRLVAFRGWRDESAAVLAEARAGVAVPAPDCPLLLLASEGDRDVPPELTRALADRLGGALLPWPGGHVDPLLGPDAVEAAGLVARWLRSRL